MAGGDAQDRSGLEATAEITSSGDKDPKGIWARVWMSQTEQVGIN